MQKEYIQRTTPIKRAEPKRALAGRVAQKGQLASRKAKSLDDARPRINIRKMALLIGVPAIIISLQFVAPYLGFKGGINLSLLWVVICLVGVIVVGLAYIGFRLVRSELRELLPSDSENSDTASGMTITARANVRPPR